MGPSYAAFCFYKFTPFLDAMIGRHAKDRTNRGTVLSLRVSQREELAMLLSPPAGELVMPLLPPVGGGGRRMELGLTTVVLGRFELDPSEEEHGVRSAV